jgi:insulysin
MSFPASRFTRRALWPVLLLWVLSACSGLDRPTSGPVAVTKSPNDRREYRALDLPNGMQALLISDPTADRAAASVNVAAGSNSDPADFAGLAHFLEHMLFLGTARYPAPAEYQEFIESHGGSHNAYTAYENTNFYFEIDAAWLPEALDRFSQFFIAPLFSEDYVNRERNAVNSEYQSGLQDDGRRNQAVLKAVVNPRHPMAGFAVGSLDTLRDQGETTLREALLAHYDRYYSANLMSVAIFGRESLDELEAMAREYFGPVVDRQRSSPRSQEPLFEPGVLPLQVNVEPIRDTRALSYSFPIPDLRRYYRQRPVDYLANILGHEGEGTLLEVLRDLGWANALSAGASTANDDVSVFNVNIALTAEGLAHVDDITALLFQYIDLVDKAGVTDWLYRELATMAELDFQYQEAAGPVGLVTNLAERLRSYPKQELITAEYFYADFDAALIRRVLRSLRPDNMLLTLSARGLPVDSTERWYGTPFSRQSVTAERQRRWADYPRSAALAIMPPNPFIPEDLALKPRLEAPLPPDQPNVLQKPTLLVDEDGIRLWFKQDNQFFAPRANFYLYALTPVFEDSLRNSLLATLVVTLVNDRLSAYAYPANLAGAGFGIGTRSRGFTLAVGGYSDKQQELLESLLKTLTAADFGQDRFDILKAEMIRSLQNAGLETPYARLGGELDALVAQPYWSTAQNIEALQTITLADVEAFVPQLLGNLRIEALYHGNVDETTARDMLALVRRYLKTDAAAPLPSYGTVLDLPEQGRIVAEMDIDHEDSAIVIYQQAPDTSLRSRALVRLLATLLGSPFFDTLRTQQQLGYVVDVGTLPILRTDGLLYTIESPVADPIELENRILAFLQDYAATLEAMPPEQFEAIKAGLLNEMRQLPERLDSLSARFWNDILLEETRTDSRLQMAEEVARLTQAGVVDYFRRHVADPAALRVVLRSVGSSHRAAFEQKRAAETATLVIEAGDSDYREFKARWPVFNYPETPAP